MFVKLIGIYLLVTIGLPLLLVYFRYKMYKWNKEQRKNRVNNRVKPEKHVNNFTVELKKDMR